MFIKLLVRVVLVNALYSSTIALNNGLALTPPMGWMSWLRYECNIDCETYPRECLSEDLIKRTADRMVSDGYRDAGYEYVIIDDCWLEMNRSADGRMVPDRNRFKSGMKSLADYIHSKGLKFGMYQDMGTKTCQGYPGLAGSEKIDVDTFAEWEIDYLKVDGCYIESSDMDSAYPAFGKLLNATGRPIVYSCSWPAYQKNPDYAAIEKHCNLWRNYDDIENSWSSVSEIMNWFGDRTQLVDYAGPGHFNDPDMLVIGNSGLSVDQARSQMAVWTILAAPLLMSVDLDEIKPEFREILLNKEVIQINQDPMGKQGRRVKSDEDVDIWVRLLANDNLAIAFVNRKQTTCKKEISLADLQIPDKSYYTMELFMQEEPFEMEKGRSKTVTLKPNGALLYKLVPSNRSNV